MKLLVLRFSSIGDIVLTSPVLRCARLQLGAEVHFLTKSAYRGIVEANPYVSKVFSFEKEPSRSLLGRLKAERYDRVVDLHHNLRSLRVKVAVGRPSRSFDKLNWEKWLLVRFKIDRLPKEHITERYMRTLADLGVAYDGEGLDYFVPEGTQLEPHCLPSRPFVAFAIGATHATKRLPDEKIAAVCSALPVPVVLLGGKSEEAAAQKVLELAGDTAHIVNLCGKLSLHQSALAMQAAQKVIAHDTGLMHIAAALRKPLVSVWGSTVPQFGMWPLYPTGSDLSASVEFAGLSCRPCSKLGHERCPQGHFKCMKGLDAQLIAALAMR